MSRASTPASWVPTPTPTRTPTPLNIGNFVWDDLDADGNQDAGEPGLSDVQGQLWDSAKTNLIASTTTNSTGNYTLIAPAGPGDYRIPFSSRVQPTSLPRDATANDSTDSDINPDGVSQGFTDVYKLRPRMSSVSRTSTPASSGS